MNMERPFVYDRYVTGKNFIGRKKDCNILGNLLEAGENVVMYAPPKSGKMSVIQQTLFNMRASGKNFLVGQLDLMNVRTLEEFLIGFCSSVIGSVSSTEREYSDFISRFLDGTHFVFDSQRFADSNEIVSISGEVDDGDIVKMFQLPNCIAAERRSKYIMVIDNFQNLLSCNHVGHLFELMEDVLKDNKEQARSVAYIFSGSRVNAMKYIFEEKKWFWKMTEALPLQPVDDREIIDYIVKGFMMSGKVVERDLILGACKLFRGNMWYLNHFIAICDSMTKGYINDGILMEALSTILSVHEPKFISIVDDLTDFQLSFLKAVLDGVTKFSSVDVIDKYHLNSSANVRRLKDALKKKEVITFNDNDEPIVLDPLFEYWIRKYYFKENE